jgi:hypothetical protein
MKKTLILIGLLLPLLMVAQTKLQDGDILVRNVVGSDLLKHYGIVYKNKIVEYNVSGLQHSSLEQFLQGKKILRIDSTLRHTKDLDKRIKATIEAYKNKEYSLKNNCESFVNQIKKGVPSSLQYELIDYTFQIINGSILKKN